MGKNENEKGRGGGQVSWSVPEGEKERRGEA